MKTVNLVVALLLGTHAAFAQTVDPNTGASQYTLQQLFDLADQRNLDLVAATESLEQANAAVRRTWGALLPVVTASGAYTRNSVEAKLAMPTEYKPVEIPPPYGDGTTTYAPGQIGEFIIQPINQWGGSIKATMPVLAMPAYFGLQSAKQGTEAARHGRLHARGEIRFGVAQAYYGAVSSGKLIELMQTQVDTAVQQERVAKVRFEAGQVPKIAFLRAGADRARAEQDLQRAKNGHAQAKLALATLTGVPEPFGVTPPTDPLPDAPTEDANTLVAAALVNRHDLAANQAMLDIAQRAVRAEWWRFAPMLQGTAEYRATNVPGFTGKKYTWLVQLAAIFTIYDGGQYADLDTAQSKAREAAARNASLRRKVMEEVNVALLELESAQANLRKAKEQQSLAEEGAQLVKTSFEAGMVSYLDVVDSTAARFSAGIAAVTEELNVRVAAIKLQKVLGRLVQDTAQPS